MKKSYSSHAIYAGFGNLDQWKGKQNKRVVTTM